VPFGDSPLAPLNVYIADVAAGLLRLGTVPTL
jgi:hypothetical protein